MNRRAGISMIMLLGVTSLTGAAAELLGPGTFELSWSTIDCGGGESAGGPFEVTATIGQPDAGAAMVGGSFEVVGGFWPGAGPIASPCPPDLDGDGNVGITDFLDLLAAWGACPDPCPPPCAADLDGDCNVGITDFLDLLAAWGPCP